MLRKACGYANLYIGTAEHEGERPADQVTISIFRAARNTVLFERMEREGTLVRGEVPGIYRVRGLMDLPFQVVVTGELKGEGYAAFRALTDGAAGQDRAVSRRVARDRRTIESGTPFPGNGVPRGYCR